VNPTGMRCARQQLRYVRRPYQNFIRVRAGQPNFAEDAQESSSRDAMATGILVPLNHTANLRQGNEGVNRDPRCCGSEKGEPATDMTLAFSITVQRTIGAGPADHTMWPRAGAPRG
jgi:hypothetical protein